MSQSPNIPLEWRRYADSAYQQGQAEAQAHFQRTTPQYTYVETAGDRQSKTRNGSMIEGLNANVMTVISALGFVVWATYFGTSQFQNLQNGQIRTENKLEQTAIEIKNAVVNGIATTTDRVARLENEVRAKAASRFSKPDMELWCAKTEQLNADIKWQCAPVINQMTENMPPIWNGVSPSWSTAITEPPRAGGVIR